MKLPASLTITEVNQAYRTRDQLIQPFLTGSPDLHGNQIMNVAATKSGEVVTYTEFFCTQAWERAFLP